MLRVVLPQRLSVLAMCGGCGIAQDTLHFTATGGPNIPIVGLFFQPPETVKPTVSGNRNQNNVVTALFVIG